jgi:hypothetical protein
VILKYWCRCWPLTWRGYLACPPRRRGQGGTGLAGTLAAGARREDHQKALPDPGCYEERYRPAIRITPGAIASLVAITLGFLWHIQPVFFVIGIVVALPAVIALARCQLAFRADHDGILLAGQQHWLTGRRGPATPIPWADVEQIICYSHEPGHGGPVRCIAIQRRTGVPVTRTVTGWRLDRARLAAVTAAVVPGVQVVDAASNTDLSIEGPSQATSTTELGPAN